MTIDVTTIDVTTIDVTTINTDVVVVGAGIGGLTAALLMARIGAEVVILDKVAHPREVGAGILLQPNGIAVLAGLGLADSLIPSGHRMSGTPIRRSDGRTILGGAVPPAPGEGESPELSGDLVALRRSRLMTELLDAVHREPAITARWGAGAVEVDTSGKVIFGSDREQLEAGLVIGADGVHSLVRSSGDFGARVRRTDSTYVRGLVQGSDLELEGEYWTRLGIFGGAPMNDGSTYFYAAGSSPTVMRALDNRDLDAFVAAWADEIPTSATILGRVRSFDDLLISPVETVTCDRWVDGRLVLLGDAAHSMEPTLGQGANSAMVDAAVLAQELMGRYSSMADALRHYEFRRMPKVRAVQRAAARLASASRATNPVMIGLRNGLLGLAGRFGAFASHQYRLAQQEDPAGLRTGVAQLAGAIR